MPEEYTEEETKFAAYADYYTTIPQIQFNYYSLMDMFEKYSVIRIKGKDNKNLKILIQVRIQKIHNMFRYYKSVKDEKNTIVFKDFNKDADIEHSLNAVFKLISDFQTSYRLMSDTTMAQCIEAITKAHFQLGLSDIEKAKWDARKAMQSYG